MLFLSISDRPSRIQEKKTITTHNQVALPFAVMYVDSFRLKKSGYSGIVQILYLH